MGEAASTGPIDIRRIMGLIPHRYPFLMIDRVANIEVNRFAIGIKNVTVNEPHFEGHFPVRPVMPGVLMIEGMAILLACGRITRRMACLWLSPSERAPSICPESTDWTAPRTISARYAPELSDKVNAPATQMFTLCPMSWGTPK